MEISQFVVDFIDRGKALFERLQNEEAMISESELEMLRHHLHEFNVKAKQLYDIRQFRLRGEEPGRA